MAIVVEKALALRVYCLARQAERSIDFGLHSQIMWNEMREFYDEERRSRVESAERALRALIPDGSIPTLNRDGIPDRRTRLVPLYLGRLAINRFRTRWRFPANEVDLLSRTFASLVAVLQLHDKPQANELVDLRLDLAACQWIIGGRLMGISALRKAERIEHFGQAAHVAAVKWEDAFPGQADASLGANSASSQLRKTA